ncbi:unnamed protein product [Phaedon cochleariae]|uniref:Craniofacial development protein 1 n=1 Tax=Phaedon cochleariae TaxID=80249 RepID=A0A9N9SGZ2_PHACE|nr:unnamed protein product [Phaedon cochleariae]
MNVDELPDESDSSDEDYDPGKQEDAPSEVDSDGEPEDILSGSEETIENGSNKTRRKKNKKQNRVKSNKRGSEGTGIEEVNENKGSVEEQKQNIDDIWADFMKDTGFKSKNNTNPAEPETPKSKLNEPKSGPQKSVDEINNKPSEKVKITQVFEFAGEEVKVVKEVAVDSAEARLLATSTDEIPKSSKGKRNIGLSGIGNVLSQLTKKPKISTLEKTKLDWDNFKKENNIEEDLQTHNKGKDGYLERQDFLQRADLRRFEIEKNIRSIERSKRFNSTL